tara:strand:+ start:217 stop:885 length:669 start_codon:yes stop_codon:yes gene_type:complete
MATKVDPTKPVGKGDYVVQDDDCMSSISEDSGHFWDTLWNLAENAALKETRKDPNVLMPGDKVTIPPITPKQVSKATGSTYQFRRKGVPAKLHLRILKQGEPRANESYRVDIDGKLTKGVTDADGVVDIYIPCKAKKGKLWVGPPEDEKMYTLQLGKTMPVERILGVKQRLKNIGYRCGSLDDEITDAYRNGLRNFQKDYELPGTGEADDATRQKLVDVHRS